MGLLPLDDVLEHLAGAADGRLRFFFTLFQSLFREEPYILFRIDIELAGDAQHGRMRLLKSICSVDIWRFRYFHVQFMDMRSGTSRKSENHQRTEKRGNDLLWIHVHKIRKKFGPKQPHEKKGASWAPVKFELTGMTPRT